jgi:hypothetical protein
MTFHSLSIMNYGPPPDLSNYTQYTVEVIAALPSPPEASPPRRSWKVARRFRDFAQFDQDLGRACGQPARSGETGSFSGQLAALPPLPRKQFWGRFSPQFLQARAAALQVRREEKGKNRAERAERSQRSAAERSGAQRSAAERSGAQRDLGEERRSGRRAKVFARSGRRAKVFARSSLGLGSG